MKHRQKSNLSLYTSRKKKKSQKESRNDQSKCKCSHSSSSDSQTPWRISNSIYEDRDARFSLPQLSSTRHSFTSLRSSANFSFNSDNRSELNVPESIFPESEIEIDSPIPCDTVSRHFSIATSTPKGKRQIFETHSSEQSRLIMDDELFSLSSVNNNMHSDSENFSSSHEPISLDINELNSALVSNEELFSLANEIIFHSRNDTTEDLESSLCGNESSIFKTALQPASRKNLVTLTNNDVISQALLNLEKHNLSEDFSNLVTCLANGRINPTDQPVLSALDFAHFQNLKDTRNMTYSQQSLDFWLCVLKLLGGPSLRLFSGPKGFGDTNYDPNLCKINFAVPSLSTLLRQNTEIPKQIMPSVFTEIIQNIVLKQDISRNEYILSYDGKGVAQGFRRPNFGVILLWSLEGPPTLKEEQEHLDMELKISANLISDINDNLFFQKDKFFKIFFSGLRLELNNCEI